MKYYYSVGIYSNSELEYYRYGDVNSDYLASLKPPRWTKGFLDTYRHRILDTYEQGGRIIELPDSYMLLRGAL